MIATPLQNWVHPTRRYSGISPIKPVKRRPLKQPGQHFAAMETTPRRRYNGTVIALSENEERLVEALRALPPDTADQVIHWTIRLRDLASGRSVDWSDTWTEEDLADARRASLSTFDERECDEI